MKTFLEERGCSLLSFYLGCHNKRNHIICLFSGFYRNLCYEIFYTTHCLLEYNQSPYCFPSDFRVQISVLDKRRSQWVNVLLKQCVFGRVAVNERYILFNRERTNWKMPEQINSVVYLYVILFKTHQKDTAIEDERFKRSTNWISKLVSAK